MKTVQISRLSVLKICAALWFSALLPFSATASDAQLKIGSLVPKNSLYHRQLMEVGETWKKSQTGSPRFNVFTDGSQGGEAEMVRRMRIGQLQAALLSVVGLREIEPSIAALQNLPLAFRSWEELDYVREKMRPSMENKFLEKGDVVLAWGDAGWVRFFLNSRPSALMIIKK
jgi:TRAP-type C4-dicarboxylate transport system substrate-binding protein